MLTICRGFWLECCCSRRKIQHVFKAAILSAALMDTGDLFLAMSGLVNTFPWEQGARTYQKKSIMTYETGRDCNNTIHVYTKTPLISNMYDWCCYTVMYVTQEVMTLPIASSWWRFLLAISRISRAYLRLRVGSICSKCLNGRCDCDIQLGCPTDKSIKKSFLQTFVYDPIMPHKMMVIGVERFSLRLG